MPKIRVTETIRMSANPETSAIKVTMSLTLLPRSIAVPESTNYATNK
jgi:hypothetical protein